MRRGPRPAAEHIDISEERGTMLVQEAPLAIKCSVKLALMSLLVASLFACSVSGGSEKDAQFPVDYEIADIRNLPQDMGAYVSSFRDDSLGKACRDSFLAEFRLKYYSPWTSDASVTDVNAFVETMKEYLRKEWYGENRRRVPGSVMEELLANCDLKHLPSLKRPAVVTAATDLRVLPREKPFFENPDAFPFDALQNAGLKLNEPIKVLHLSMDGLWAFIETADTNGWVLARDIGYMDGNMAGKWMDKDQIVIVTDSSVVRDKSGAGSKRVNAGTICPLVAEKGDFYEISVPVNAGLHNVKISGAKIPKESAAKFPLKPDRETVSLVGGALIGKPYGWGEKFQNRDCSAMIRDFYLPFGIWLPRGSYNQINYGKRISLAGLSNSEKERLITEKGVPFFTLVYRKGHIMLYVGSRNDKALIFHNIWGLNVRDGKGGEYKRIIGKAIVSTLNPGSELDLADGPLLDRVTNMLVLVDRCTGVNK